ncbi:Fc.00g010030.m01.CDS01 [Cosmosporella sp. VM-42]
MPRLPNINSQFVFSALCLPPLVNGGCLPEKACKAYPGGNDWPSQDLWNHLNSTLDGRLILPTPPGAVCHPGWPTYDTSQCPAVASNWSVYEFHTDNPISVMWDQFSNDTCLPNPEYPCSTNAYPAYVVNATTPDHVKAGVDFAREHDVRLVVKGTGHDYLGRSIAPGALSIWTHHMNEIVLHENEFKLEGSDTKVPGCAITVGCGTQMWDIYSATDKINQTVVGGGGKSVGIGGYITGGGHSVLSPRFGMAADQVLQMEMVTPGGKIITINEDQHSDLFWAMRGGGGSTFGVLTSITLKTHPTPKIRSSMVLFVTVPEAPFIYDLFAYALSKFPSLAHAGLSGYTYMTTRFPNPIPSPGAPDEIAGVAGSFITQNSEDTNEMNEIWGSINTTIQERWPNGVQTYMMTKEHSSFLDWFSEHYDQGAAGNDSYIVSRLLDEKALESAGLVDALKAATGPSNGFSAFLVSGKGVHNAKPRGGGDAVNPAWRRSLVHFLSGMGFPPFNATAKAEAIKTLNEAFEPMRELTPNTGAYINEAFPFEDDWQHTFWAENYRRLLKIKRKVDPQDVLWCVPCVGNERWKQEQDGRLCRIDSE